MKHLESPSELCSISTMRNISFSPDVEWLHDPGPERGDLPDDFVPVTISEQFIRHPAVGLGNAGRYTCKGSNQFATVTKDIYVVVIEPSHICKTPKASFKHNV